MTTVMLFIVARSTELLWKLINCVNSYPCSEKELVDGIYTAFYLRENQKPWHFLVVLAQSCSPSLHFREVDL